MAILTINEILYEFSKEMGFERLGSDKKMRNKDRFFNNKVSLEKKYKNLFESLIKIVSPIVNLIPKKVDDNFDLFILVRKFIQFQPSIIFSLYFKFEVLDKIISQKAEKDEIFFQIFKYAFIPLLIKSLDEESRKDFKELLPNKTNSTLEQFIKFTGLGKDNLEDNNFYKEKIDENDVLNLSTKVIENFRKAKERSSDSNLSPVTLKYIFDNFPNSPYLVLYFLYSKFINSLFKFFGKKRGCQLVSYIENLIDNPESDQNKKLLELDTEFIVLEINKNLAKYSSNILNDHLKKIAILENSDDLVQLEKAYRELIDFGQKEEMIGNYLSETQEKYKKISRNFHQISKAELESKFISIAGDKAFDLNNLIYSHDKTADFIDKNSKELKIKYENGEKFLAKELDKYINLIKYIRIHENAGFKFINFIGTKDSIKDIFFPNTPDKELKIIFGRL